MHESGADCRVDTPGKGAEHSPAANRVSDGARRLLDEGRRLPATAATGHLVKKVAQDLAALGRVNDFGMEGDAKPSGIVRHRRDRLVLRSEERRVGKECRSRWGPEDEKKRRKE